MIVTLKGEAKDAHSGMAGIYILGPNMVNGKSHWLQNPGTNAIWYTKEKRHWHIADQVHLGNDRAWIFSSEDVAGPQEATTWEYYDDKWIISDDILVDTYAEPGMSYIIYQVVLEIETYDVTMSNGNFKLSVA